jgi:hypothetical protein
LSVGTFDETLVMTFNMTAIGLKLIAWDDNLNINMLIDWIQIDEV